MLGRWFTVVTYATAMAWWPRSGVATKPMPQAARLPGTSPGQARRVESAVGGTDLQATGNRRIGLVS